MTTVREHLKKAHGEMAKHHLVMAQGHRDTSELFGKLAKLNKADVDAVRVYDGLKDSHAGMADDHERAAGFHKGEMEECSKALGDEMNKIVPDRVSSVRPPGVRMVLRTGQREPGDMDKIAPEFRELVGLSDLD